MQRLLEQIADLSAEQKVDFLIRRLQRAEDARVSAEGLLDSRARELDDANRELRKREEKLRERLDINMRQLLAAQKTASLATVYRERSGRTAFSPQFARLLGLEENAPLDGAALALCVHPLDRDRIENEEYDFYHTKPAGADHTYEHRIIRQDDGEVRWLRWTLRREVDGEGRFLSVSGTVQDITETREATRRAQALGLAAERRVRMLSELMQELEDSTRSEQQVSNFLQAVLDSVPQGIAVFDPDLKLAAWNAQLVSLTEIEPEALRVGMPFKSPPPQKPGAIALTDAGTIKRDADGQIVDETYERELSDGRIVQVDVLGRDDGSMVRIYSDVSRFKTVEASLRGQRQELSARVDELISLSFELRKAKSEAERASRYKSQFLAMMSHDIRTPMNGVLGLLDTLALTELTPEQRKQLDLSRAAGRQLNFLLNEIIEIVRAESGKINLEPEPVEIASTLEGVIEFWARANVNPLVALSLDLGGTLPDAVMLDPTRLRQLIDNFVSNALKYTAEGKVIVRAYQAGDNLRFEVCDTGQGIRKQDQQQLFADFARLRTMPVTTGPSAGLGLAICKRLVAAMDGDIGVDSAPGEGSTFWFELPIIHAERRHTDHAGMARDLDSIPQLGLHVLIAEDLETNRIVLTAMLDKLACTYICVENGAEALAAVQQESFDCILMDVNMPEMDGREATLAIRDLLPPRNRIAIIGVTAHVLADTQQDLLNSGMTAILPKPVSLQSLAQILAQNLETDTHAGAAAAVEAAPHPDVLDTEVTAVLFDSLPEEQMRKIVAQSITDIEGLAADYADAAASHDENSMRRAAHSLKGVAANMGAVGLAKLLAPRALAAPADVTALAAKTVAGLRHVHQ